LEDSGSTVQTDFLGDAYLCPNDCTPGNYPRLPQGDSFSYCVTTNTPNTHVDECTSITISQADYGNPQVTGRVLSNALDDIFTSGGCTASCCRYTTILDQAWFIAPNSVDPEDQPGDLTITGTCEVGFGAFRRNLRELQENQTPVSQSFGGVDVSLKYDDNNSAAPASSKVAAMAAAGAGLAMAVML